MVIKMTIISKKLIKIYLLFFFTIVSCIACDFGHKSEINVSTSSSPIIKKFERDAIYIFGNNIINMEAYLSYNADRLIFQIKNDYENDNDFLVSIND